MYFSIFRRCAHGRQLLEKIFFKKAVCDLTPNFPVNSENPGNAEITDQVKPCTRIGHLKALDFTDTTECAINTE